MCLFGVLIVGFGGESEAQCEAQGGWICFSREAYLLIAGLYGFFVWIVGAVIIALAWGLVRMFRGDPPHADGDPRGAKDDWRGFF